MRISPVKKKGKNRYEENPWQMKQETTKKISSPYRHRTFAETALTERPGAFLRRAVSLRLQIQLHGKGAFTGTPQ